MPKISLNQDIRSLTDFRSNVSRFISQVHSTRRPMVITQHGRSSAVLLDVNEYEKMVDKLELIEDIETATKQLNEGLAISHRDAKKMLKARISA